MASTPIPHILFVLLPHRSECCLPFIAAAGKVTFLTQLNPGQHIYMPDMLVAIVALKQYCCAQQRGIRVYCGHMGGQSKGGMARPFSYPRHGHRCRPRHYGTEPFWHSLLNRSCHFFNDNEVRSNILRTAEICGNTLSSGNKKHYALANIALVGEAIMLAMRTNAPANL